MSFGVVRVDAFQQVLDAETLAADLLHLALVLFVDGLHDIMLPTGRAESSALYSVFPRSTI